jgi:hypothetical protein
MNRSSEIPHALTAAGHAVRKVALSGVRGRGISTPALAETLVSQWRRDVFVWGVRDMACREGRFAA